MKNIFRDFLAKSKKGRASSIQQSVSRELTDVQASHDFPSGYGIRMFDTVFTSARHWTLS
jgi:hypothetical protein